MHRNMGTVDRLLRLLFSAVIATLYASNRISGTLAIVLGVVAVLSFVTGLTGWCAIYTLLGISTRKELRAATPKA